MKSRFVGSELGSQPTSTRQSSMFKWCTCFDPCSWRTKNTNLDHSNLIYLRDDIDSCVITLEQLHVDNCIGTLDHTESLSVVVTNHAVDAFELSTANVGNRTAQYVVTRQLHHHFVRFDCSEID